MSSPVLVAESRFYDSLSQKPGSNAGQCSRAPVCHRKQRAMGPLAPKSADNTGSARAPLHVLGNKNPGSEQAPQHSTAVHSEGKPTARRPHKHTHTK